MTSSSVCRSLARSLALPRFRRIAPARKHRLIALITCEGAYHEEAVMTEAMLFKARQLGADAVVQNDATTVQTGGGGMYRGTGGGRVGGRSLFHLTAIVYLGD